MITAIVNLITLMYRHQEIEMFFEVNEYESSVCEKEVVDIKVLLTKEIAHTFCLDDLIDEHIDECYNEIELAAMIVEDLMTALDRKFEL